MAAQAAHSRSNAVTADRAILTLGWTQYSSVRSVVRIENSPENKEKKEQYEHNQQNQVWYNLWLHVLLIVWCVVTSFKLDFSSRGHSGIKAAGLQACRYPSKVVLWMQKHVSITFPIQPSRKAAQELTLQAATSQTSLSTVTFRPSTSIVVVESTDAADEVPKQQRNTANDSSRGMLLHCAMVTCCYYRCAVLVQLLP